MILFIKYFLGIEKLYIAFGLLLIFSLVFVICVGLCFSFLGKFALLKLKTVFVHKKIDIKQEKGEKYAKKHIFCLLIQKVFVLLQYQTKVN